MIQEAPTSHDFLTVLLFSTRNLVPEEGKVYFYIPLFANSSQVLDGPLSGYYSFFLALELFLICISGIVNTALIFSLYSNSLIHTNLKAIWMAHLFEYFVFAISQIVLICYQVGMYSADGTVAKDIWIILAGEGKMYYMWGIMLIQPATVLERAIATKYICNYETLKNPKIAVLLVLCKFFLTLMISSSIVLCIVRYNIAALLCVFDLGITATLYIALFSYNSRLLSSSSVSVYTLSSKYQVTENLRILTLLRNVFVLIVMAVIVVVSIMGVLRIFEYGELQPFAAVLSDMIIAGVPIEIMLVSAWHFREKSTVRRADSSADEHARESLIYFKQLNNSWSKRNRKVVFKRI